MPHRRSVIFPARCAVVLHSPRLYKNHSFSTFTSTFPFFFFKVPFRVHSLSRYMGATWSLFIVMSAAIELKITYSYILSSVFLPLFRLSLHSLHKGLLTCKVRGRVSNLNTYVFHSNYDVMMHAWYIRILLWKGKLKLITVSYVSVPHSWWLRLVFPLLMIHTSGGSVPRNVGKIYVKHKSSQRNIHITIYIPIYLSKYLSIYLCIYPSIFLSVYLSMYLVDE